MKVGTPTQPRCRFYHGREFIPLILSCESFGEAAVLPLQDRPERPRGPSCSSVLPVCVCSCGQEEDRMSDDTQTKSIPSRSALRNGAAWAELARGWAAAAAEAGVGSLWVGWTSSRLCCCCSRCVSGGSTVT